MGTKPILPLLVSMSVPSILSMLIQSLYNVVDSIFVAWLSNDALTAVSLAYPLQNLVLAVAVGFGVGINAYIARNLGEGNQYKVDQAASMGVIFTTIHAVIFILVGLFGSEPFLRMFTDDPEILQMSVNYTRIRTNIIIAQNPNIVKIFFKEIWIFKKTPAAAALGFRQQAVIIYLSGIFITSFAISIIRFSRLVQRLSLFSSSSQSRLSPFLPNEYQL